MIGTRGRVQGLILNPLYRVEAILDYAIQSLKVLSFALGVVMLGHVLFAYEDEEKKLKNWLETAWISLTYGEAKISVRLNGSLHALLRGLNAVLDRCYGSRLFSVQASTSAICFIFAFYAFRNMYLGSSKQFAFSLAAGVALLVVALSAKQLLQIASAALSIAFLILMILGLREYFTPYSWDFTYRSSIDMANLTRNDPTLAGLGGRVFAFCLVIASEILAIAGIRQSLRAASRSTSLRRTLLFVTVATLIAPLLLQLASFTLEVHSKGRYSENLQKMAQINVVPLLMSASFFLVVFCAVIFRLTYAIAPRAVYSLLKLKLLENRKASASVGILLIAGFFPEALTMLEKIVKPLG